MFKVYLSNFYRFTDGEFATLEEAKAECKRVAFECMIYMRGDAYMKYSPISGFSVFIY